MSAECNDPYAPYRSDEKYDRDWVPRPVIDSHPEWVALYDVAWESAWRHVVIRDDMPFSPYLDEALTPDRIWIFDTCFMAMYARYAPARYPGTASLDNLYAILHDGTPGVQVHFADNPPLFAWVEEQYYQLTGDQARLSRLLVEKKYLQRHFSWYEGSVPTGKPEAVLAAPCARFESIGYRWRGNTSGMDNTPRGRTGLNDDEANPRGQNDNVPDIYWLDLLAQQIQSAATMARLMRNIGEDTEAAHYDTIHAEKKALLQRYYWCDSAQCFYDVLALPSDELERRRRAGDTIHCAVPTIASYWPLLAGAASAEQADAMAQKAADPSWFGGTIPYPTLARHDPEYRAQGRYWRGGVWLPTAYMATKALERYGYYDLARGNAERLVTMMARTYAECDPHTIWEAYAPERPLPASHKDDCGGVRTDFCGWSALGPISMLIENILGFTAVSAAEKRLTWRLHRGDRHGIRNFRFGDCIADLIYDRDTITIRTTAPFTLTLWRNGLETDHDVPAGDHIISCVPA